MDPRPKEELPLDDMDDVALEFEDEFADEEIIEDELLDELDL